MLIAPSTKTRGVKMWTLMLQGVLIIQLQNTIAIEFKSNGYLVQEQPQEFSSPWTEVEHPYAFSGANYVDPQEGVYPTQYVPQHLLQSYNQQGSVYQDYIPSIHSYKPNFQGKDYNEYPHILPPGGKSIEQLQQEADLRIKKIYLDSRDNQKMVEEKIRKLANSYGYGTIGYPGYRNTIKYEPIDLGTHNAIDLGTTLDGPGGNLRLPIQTVTVTKTLGVRVPQPYPVRQEVPVPAPFPVPVAEHYGNKEVRQYFGAVGSEFAGRANFAFVNGDTKTAIGSYRPENSKH